MTSSFLYLDGFFVCWKEKGELCKVFTKSKKQADYLFVMLLKNKEVEKYKVENGKMKKIA